MGLTEAEQVKKSGENTQNCTKDLHDPDNHEGVITPLEPDTLECEVKWALGRFTRNKTGGSDGIPAELFQVLKDDAVKVLYSICEQIWKTSQFPKGQSYSNPIEGQSQRIFKLPYSCSHFTC